MSVRVVARIRPLLKAEREADSIVQAPPTEPSKPPSIVRIPNPKNEAESFSFSFNSVYDQDTTQQELFDAEVAPTIKHLFSGFDVTIFAYGVTGTGKTHTMRGGKSLADRGVIPRLLSGIYRRSRKLEKDSQGATKVDVLMSYYEIYNDRVFDLFEAPEKRTPSGLPLRDNGGKTVVVGLTERPCESLKEFESLYDQANINRSTSATKLNAHSSRSHAILCVKLVVTNGEQTMISTASAIDLAGSEDNRRTDNGKDRMVESASINKSLFVLAQCVEAISKKQQRIPYRESKMTRILSIGQNEGLMVMILNLAPVRSYHLDTLSSLNFANRTKKIEVREVENEPIFKGPPRAVPGIPSVTGASIQRQPLRPLASSVNANLGSSATAAKQGDKPMKAFSVYSDTMKQRSSGPSINLSRSDAPKKSSPLKRGSGTFSVYSSRPAKVMRPGSNVQARQPSRDVSQANIEHMVERKVEEILAARALKEAAQPPAQEISEQVQRRLEVLEQRIEGKEDERAEGLSYLLMAKQHHARGEDASALKMYQLALPYFPSNDKLTGKITALQDKISAKKETSCASSRNTPASGQPVARQFSQPHSKLMQPLANKLSHSTHRSEDHSDDEYCDSPDPLYGSEDTSDDDFCPRKRQKKVQQRALKLEFTGSIENPTPRTSHLLRIINSRDVDQIRLLKGVGVKKAENIVDCLCDMDDAAGQDTVVQSLGQLGKLKGVGLRTVEAMRNGIDL